MIEKSETSIEPRVAEWMAELRGYKLSDTAIMGILTAQLDIAIIEDLLIGVDATMQSGKNSFSIFGALLQARCPELLPAFNKFIVCNDFSYRLKDMALRWKVSLIDRILSLLKGNRRAEAEKKEEIA